MKKYYYTLTAILVIFTCSGCEMFYKGYINYGSKDIGESSEASTTPTQSNKPTWNQYKAMLCNMRGHWAKEYGKNYQGAIEEFSKGLELDHEHAYLYIDRGYTYDDLGQYKNAIDDFNQAIKLDPKNKWGYLGRGGVYEELGQLQKAIDDFNYAINLDPKDASAYNGRGWGFALQNKFKNASEDALKAVQLDPKMAEAYDTLGYAQSGLGIYDKALDSYNSAIKLDPNDGEQYYHRAQLYEKLHNRNMSNGDYGTAKQLGYIPKQPK